MALVDEGDQKQQTLNRATRPRVSPACLMHETLRLIAVAIPAANATYHARSLLLGCGPHFRHIRPAPGLCRSRSGTIVLRRESSCKGMWQLLRHVQSPLWVGFGEAKPPQILDPAHPSAASPRWDG